MVKHFNEIATAVFVVVLIYSGIQIGSKYVDIVVDKPIRQELVVKADTPSEKEKESFLDVVSPDEKMTLNMRNLKNDDGTIDQTFTIINNKDNSKKELLKLTSAADKELLIPFNTFSPTDKFIFLKENTAFNPEYLVIRTDGQAFMEDKKYLEVRALFNEGGKDLKITDITGWAGYTLLLINTDTNEGNSGPSWWLDMSNRSFIRLNTRFN